MSASALLLPNEILSMSAQAARRLVESGDGEAALLYLALLESGGDGPKAAAKLRWPDAHLHPAWERLAALGLVQPLEESKAPAPAPKQDDRPPEYTRAELTAAQEREPEFRGLCREMENMLGRVFSDNDLKCLYTIYDHLAFPPEVILLLTGWSIQQERRQKNNPAACPRMPQIQRNAFAWKSRGIDTLERAEEHIRRQEMVDGREWAVLQAVGVAERRTAVPRERTFITSWVADLGMSDELIRLAYERTVYQKGTMNWPYMNKILESWHKAGYKTPAQVEAEDKPAKRGRPAPPSQDFQPSQERIQKNNDWLDEFLAEQQRKGGG